nr:polysaccharide deacetylase family protein [uncultured Desulfobacter sp.]
MKILRNTIINLHAVDNKDWMEKTFLLIKRHYNLVTIDDLLDYYHSGKKLSNACHITFDDGDNSFYDIVFPILKKHNIPCSIYVSPEALVKRFNFWFQEIAGYDPKQLRIIIKNRKYVSCNPEIVPITAIFKMLTIEKIWCIISDYQQTYGVKPKPCMNMDVEQLKEIDASGLVEIGAHTMNHPILKNESDESSEYEVKKSVEELGTILGKPIKSFAYPNGQPELDFSEREKRFLRQAGVQISFSEKIDHFSRENDLYSIPRNGLAHGNQAFILLKMLMGKNWLKLKHLKNKKNQEYYRRLMLSGGC